MDAGAPVTPGRPAAPLAAGPAPSADATRTTAGAADRPLSTPLPFPIRPTTARTRGSSIRLRRLTSTSQASDTPNPDGYGNDDAFSLQPLTPGRFGEDGPSRLQPLSPAGSHLSPDLRHVTFLPQIPGDRNSAPGLSSMSNIPAGLRTAQPSTSTRQDDKHKRKERMAMFGRHRLWPGPSDDADKAGDTTQQPLENKGDHSTMDNNKRWGQRASLPLNGENDYDADIVDMLDVLDPEVSTMSSITNVQNSLFVPSLGRFVNRRPAFNLTPYPRSPESPARDDDEDEEESDHSPVDKPARGFKEEGGADVARHKKTLGTAKELPPLPLPIERLPSVLTANHFAVRPSDTSLATWTDEDLADLNDHVRHMLHSRRSKVGRRLRAFGQYVSRPMGFFVTLYASIIILLGTAWVVFLIGWISVGDEQSIVIGTINLALVTLFSLVGIGLIPWRAVDTYHMIYIVRLEHIARKRLQAAGATDTASNTHAATESTVRIVVENADGNGGGRVTADLESGRDRKGVNADDLASALNLQQRNSLEHHQACFAKSHTFYKPRDSETHHAFPVRLLIAIVILLDGNSVFQLALALCTWTIRYRSRPMSLTVSLLCCAMACNISAAILISIGDRRTRKKDAVERMWRQELTREAIRRKEKKIKAEEDKRRIQLERVKEEEEYGGRTSSQWLRKSLDVVRGREISVVV
ncbi:uncharacterized protein B0I36DRAFT_386211 [Microdochium trichocladiopsis]|uniref:Integral membrane protein n=1 Tax=Microdochium trichocladiopsis TaxID=1682393 RepID=A0A9P8XZ68_9PEZI|nr:uncharacterized protein B0I36DRAFT_386211 [Microdochium trichocladiopsis]KAH7025818.1 hypothetical protein B0I36DRAFT_386211 [Microdochium trichocladiopsis]